MTNTLFFPQSRLPFVPEILSPVACAHLFKIKVWALSPPPPSSWHLHCHRWHVECDMWHLQSSTANCFLITVWRLSGAARLSATVVVPLAIKEVVWQPLSTTLFTLYIHRHGTSTSQQGGTSHTPTNTNARLLQWVCGHLCLLPPLPLKSNSFHCIPARVGH